jgi:hypothetical protein
VNIGANINKAEKRLGFKKLGTILLQIRHISQDSPSGEWIHLGCCKSHLKAADW